MKHELEEFDKYFENHVNGHQRVDNKEDCIFRLTFKGLNTEAYNRHKMKENRIHAMIEDMTKKFGDQVLGVHG